MTDTDTPPSAPTDSWDALLDVLRRRYPGQRDSVLFCIHKLQQNPDLTLRDFRDEARLYGIPVAGRSLHSARVLLGLQKPTPARAAATDEADGEAEGSGADDLAPATAPRRRRARSGEGEDASASIEQQVVAAMRRMQSAAEADTERLRDAIRDAIAILQRAIDD